jgi:exosortase
MPRMSFADGFRRRQGLAAGVAMAAGFALVYRDVLVKLVHDWWTDDNYSHGIFIVPLAVYFGWQRRQRLASARHTPSIIGLFLVLGSLATLVAGVLGADLFLTRISIIGTVAGIVLFVFGRDHLHILRFPIAFLLLMIPIPAIIFNQIAFPLQLLASRVGELALAGLSVPVLREGNIIILPHTTLEVAEACSGIRSLVSLLTLGIVYGYFADSRAGVRLTIALATVPIAIAANGLRVAGTGLAAQRFGPAAAAGFFHTFSGWLVFASAFALLVPIEMIVSRIASLKRPQPLAFRRAS